MAHEIKLTEMQEAYCHEYLVDFHQEHAAIRAGSKPSNAAHQASQWHSMPKIQARIAQIRAQIGKTHGQSLDRTVQQLALMANAQAADMFDVDGEIKPLKEWPEGLRLCVAGVEMDTRRDPFTGDDVVYVKKVKLIPKEKIHDMLMRHQGGYMEDNKQKQTNMTVVVDISDDDGPETKPNDSDPDSEADD